jgi:hypothetical protein
MRALDYTPKVLVKLREEIERFCKGTDIAHYNEELLKGIKQTLKNLFPQLCSYTFGSDYFDIPYIPRNKEEYDRMIDGIKLIEKRVGDKTLDKTFFKRDTYIFYAYNEKYETSYEFDEYAVKVLQLDHDWFDDPSFYYRLTKALNKILLDDEIGNLNGKLSKLKLQIQEAQHIVSSIQGEKDKLCRERRNI